MFRTRRLVCVLVALASAISVVALTVGSAGATGGCTDTYSGASNGDWGVGSNWNTGVVPASSDVACIPAGVTVDVEESGDQAAAIGATSTTPGNLDVVSGRLTLSSTSVASVVQNFSMTEDGTLDGPSAPGAGALTIDGTSDITSVYGQGTSTIGSTLAVTQQGSGTLTIGGTNPEDEFLDSSYDDQSSGAVAVDPSLYLEGQLTSAEPITFADGTYTGAGGAFKAPGVSISGAVDINLPIELTGSSTLGGMLTISDGLTLDASATIDTGSSGDGVEFTGGTSTIDGTIDGSGTFEADGGTTTLESNSSYKLTKIDVQGGTLDNDIASLTSITAITVDHGTFNLANGGTLTDSGSFEVELGTVGIVGNGNSTLTLKGNTDITSLSGQGTSTIDSGIAVTQTGTGTLTIGGAGDEAEFIDSPIDDQSTGAVAVYPSMYLEGLLTSIEPITMADGTYDGAGSPGIKVPSISISGAVTLGVPTELTADSKLGGMLTVDNVLTLDNGATLDTNVSGDGVEFIGGSSVIDGTISGDGTFEATNNPGFSVGTVTLESDSTFTAPAIAVDSGTVDDDLASLTVGDLSLSNGYFNIVAGGSVDDTGNFLLDIATIDGVSQSNPATLTVGGNLEITSVNNNGESTFGPNLSATQNGSGTFAIGAESDTEGEVIAGTITTNTTDTTSGAVAIGSTLGGNAGGSIVSTNEPIDFTQSGLDAGSIAFTAPRFVIGVSDETLTVGSLTQTGSGTTTVASGATLDTAGDVGGAFGTIDVTDGSFAVDGSVQARVTLTGGATLKGSGTIDGEGYGQSNAVENSAGVVSPGDSGTGTLTLEGSYIQSSAGQLAVPISGTAAGDYPVLDVSGFVSLAGTVQAEPTSGYAASANEGDSFGVISYAGSVGGTFSTVSSEPALHDSESLSVSDDSTDKLVDLVVGAPAPPNNSAAPYITDGGQQVTTADVGDMLTCNAGTWSENPTFSYSWDSGASPITDANGSTYRVQATDAGASLTCVVNATVGSSNAQATSAGVSVNGPQNSAVPTITGSAQPGNTLTCHPGTWTESPTFSYQWDRNGSAITNATGSTYAVATADVGNTLTCVVTATVGSSNAHATSAGVLVTPLPTPTPPQTTTPPSVTGTPLPGDTLTCDPGSWTESPTFSYQWKANGSPIVGANSQTLVVTISEEGQTISCVVTASSGSGQTQASATAVTVAIKGTLTCPQPTGGVSGTTLGLWHLGMTKAQARKVSKFYTVTKFGFDRFCMYGGWGVRTGYASSLLTQKLPQDHAKSLVGKVVMILAANTHYSVDGIRPGTALATIAHTVKLSKPFKIGLNTWYLIKGTSTTGVLKVAGGIAQEVGIANKNLTTGSAASQRVFLSTFRQG